MNKAMAIEARVAGSSDTCLQQLGRGERAVQLAALEQLAVLQQVLQVWPHLAPQVLGQLAQVSLVRVRVRVKVRVRVRVS